MNHGLSIRDVVKVKASGVIGQVIGIEELEDRYPANLCLYIPGDQEHSLGEDFSLIKVRSDEVDKISHNPYFQA